MNEGKKCESGIGEKKKSVIGVSGGVLGGNLAVGMA